MGADAEEPQVVGIDLVGVGHGDAVGQLGRLVLAGETEQARVRVLERGARGRLAKQARRHEHLDARGSQSGPSSDGTLGQRRQKN